MALFGATIQIVRSIDPRYKMHSQTLMDVFFRAFGTPGRPLVTNDFRVELPLGAIAIRCGSYLPVIAAALHCFFFYCVQFIPTQEQGILIWKQKEVKVISMKKYVKELKLTDKCGQ